MVEPIFKKCLKAITQINEQLLPAMNQSYNNFATSTQRSILGNECMNRSRMYTKSALEAQDSGQIDNAQVRNALMVLARVDEKLNSRTRFLNDLLSEIKRKYSDRSRRIAQLNNDYLNEMKNGNTPAEELLSQIVRLGKDIQKIIKEEIPGYEKEVTLFMKKAEGMICDEAERTYNKIVQFDRGTMPHKSVREWTYIPDAFLRTSGAFTGGSYEV